MGFWWSLGAEEAFYLISPFLLLPLFRRLRRMTAYIVALTLIGVTAFGVRTILAIWLLPEIAGNVS